MASNPSDDDMSAEEIFAAQAALAAWLDSQSLDGGKALIVMAEMTATIICHKAVEDPISGYIGWESCKAYLNECVRKRLTKIVKGINNKGFNL